MLIPPSSFSLTDGSWSSTQDGVRESAGPILGVLWDAADESGSSPTEDGLYPEYLQISDFQTLISALLYLFRLHFGSFI